MKHLIIYNSKASVDLEYSSFIKLDIKDLFQYQPKDESESKLKEISDKDFIPFLIYRIVKSKSEKFKSIV